MSWSRVVVLTVTFGLCAACTEDEPAERDPGAALTVDQVISFTNDYHARTPFREDTNSDPLADCAWLTAQKELDEWGEGSAALFRCTAGTDDEDGAYPVVVYQYQDASAALDGIEDRLLSNDQFVFVENTIVVDSFSVEDESARAFYEALIEDCECGEVLVVGKDL